MERFKQILRYEHAGISQREIAKILSVSRNTVSKTVNARKAAQLDWDQITGYTEAELELKLFPQVTGDSLTFYYPMDVEYLMRELKKPGVTKKLLWEEYVKECHSIGKQLPYQYTQFCTHLNRGIEQSKATMYFEHTAGEKAETDWAGTTYHIVDSETNETKKVFFFVATLPYSQLTYVEATLDMKEEQWINAHINFFEFIQGSPKIIVCDNLKTGVIKHPKRGDVVLNAAYQEMADYYKTAIIPAKPRTPKGKASVEGAVGQITTQIIAKLRYETFYNLYDLNQRILELLVSINEKGFQKRKGSRLEVFLTEEKTYLQLLPKVAYEYGIWKSARVQYNYHIAIDKIYYSVPYHYIKKDVRVRITQNRIEIFHQHTRVCSHRRLYGRPGQYVTVEEHMPINHRQAGEWNRHRFIKWANNIGPHTTLVIERLLDTYKVEQQAFNGCLSILKLTDKYTEKQLESACEQAISIIHTPRYRNIKRIIEAQLTNQSGYIQQPTNQSDTSQHVYLRGQDYYGKKD